MKYLGKHFDIHTGGVDHIPVHHSNEIAQNEGATGHKAVNFWLHGAFLTFKGQKVSKSKGGLYTISELEKMGFEPMAFKYLTLTSHYHSILEFSIKSLKSAQEGYERLKNIVGEIKNDKKANKNYLNQFKKAINDNLDMPKALSILWKLIRDKKATGKIKTIQEFDKVLGLNLLKKEELKIPTEIKKLVAERETARKQKNFQKSDELRAKIKSLGYFVEDAINGSKIKKL
jgi:cysteinyl-tRNA synthetase